MADPSRTFKKRPSRLLIPRVSAGEEEASLLPPASAESGSAGQQQQVEVPNSSASSPPVADAALRAEAGHGSLPEVRPLSACIMACVQWQLACNQTPGAQPHLKCSDVAPHFAHDGDPHHPVGCSVPPCSLQPWCPAAERRPACSACCSGSHWAGSGHPAGDACQQPQAW